jgi:alpha,alpha-trehalase
LVFSHLTASFYRPPHAYTAIKAFEAVGRLYPNGTVLDQVVTTDFSLVPPGQFGLNQSQIPSQNVSLVSVNTRNFRADLTAIQAGKPWWQGESCVSMVYV